MTGRKFSFYLSSTPNEVEEIKREYVDICPSLTQSTSLETIDPVDAGRRFVFFKPSVTHELEVVKRADLDIYPSSTQLPSVPNKVKEVKRAYEDIFPSLTQSISLESVDPVDTGGRFVFYEPPEAQEAEAVKTQLSSVLNRVEGVKMVNVDICHSSTQSTSYDSADPVDVGGRFVFYEPQEAHNVEVVKRTDFDICPGLTQLSPVLNEAEEVKKSYGDIYPGLTQPTSYESVDPVDAGGRFVLHEPPVAHEVEVVKRTDFDICLGLTQLSPVPNEAEEVERAHVDICPSLTQSTGHEYVDPVDAGGRFVFYEPPVAHEVEVVKRVDVDILPGLTQSLSNETEEDSVEPGYAYEDAAEVDLAVIEEATSKKLAVLESFRKLVKWADMDICPNLTQSVTNTADDGSVKLVCPYDESATDVDAFAVEEEKSKESAVESEFSLKSSINEDCVAHDATLPTSSALFGAQTPTVSSTFSESLKSTQSMVHYTANETTAISLEFETVLLDRIQTMDHIQKLLEDEMEKEKNVIDFADSVVALEDEVVSKNECIDALNRQVEDLKARDVHNSQRRPAPLHPLCRHALPPLPASRAPPRTHPACGLGGRPRRARRDAEGRHDRGPRCPSVIHTELALSNSASEKDVQTICVAAINEAKSKDLTVKSKSSLKSWKSEDCVASNAASASPPALSGVETPAISPPISKSLNPIESTTPNTDDGKTAISLRLEAMMLSRVKAMDNFQNLLEDELEKGKTIMDFTDNVAALEDDAISKNEYIDALNRQIGDLEARNDHNSQQLRCLSLSITELAHSNSELEKDVRTKKNKIKKMEEDIGAKQMAMDKKAEENDALKHHLETFNANNNALKAMVEDFQVKNIDYSNKLEGLVSSLNEKVVHNNELEGQVGQLQDAYKTLEDASIPISEKNAKLSDDVERLTSLLNEANFSKKKEINHLKKKNEDMIKLWSKEKENDSITIHQLKEEIKSLNNKLGDEQSAKEELLARKASFDVTVEILNEEIESLNKIIGDERGVNEELLARRASLYAQIVNARKTLAETEENLERERQVVITLQEVMEKLRKKLGDEQSSKSQLSSQKTSLQARVASLEASLEELIIVCENEASNNRQLRAENKRLKKETKKEQDRNAHEVCQLKKVLEETRAQSTEQANDLMRLLEEAKASYKNEANGKEQLQNEIYDFNKSASETSESRSATIELLEKALEEGVHSPSKMRDIKRICMKYIRKNSSLK